LKVGGVSNHDGGGGLILTSSHDDMLTSMHTVRFQIEKEVHFLIIQNISKNHPKIFDQKNNKFVFNRQLSKFFIYCKE